MLTETMRALLEVKGLKKYFPVTKGLLWGKVTGWVKAVDEVDFSIDEGKTFGLVGESGCGKTTAAKLILLLEKPTSGSIIFRGKNIARFKRNELTLYRASVQAVFQDPYSSLNPRMRVGSIIAEPLIVNNVMPKKRMYKRVEEILNQVGLDSGTAKLYPHEFSGGQRQRIAVARALAMNPTLILLDEPVSALDVSIRAQIMNLLKELQERFAIAYLLIAHNLATVRYMSHHVGVMYLGKIVESSDSEELFSHPLHPYTKALLSAALPFLPGDIKQNIPLTGEVPSPLNPPRGCRFHTRCLFKMPKCSELEPILKPANNHHIVACHLH